MVQQFVFLRVFWIRLHCKRKITFLLIGQKTKNLAIVDYYLKIQMTVWFFNIQGAPKKCTCRTKLSAVGLNFTMDMTLGRLILFSLSKKRPKTFICVFECQSIGENNALDDNDSWDDDDDKNCGCADDYQLISTSNCRQQPLHSKSFFQFPFLQFFKAR